MYEVPRTLGDGRPLEPAWSPLSWLRIVYAVWFDQLWYWREIRPRLHGKTVSWPLVAQAYAGSLLGALALQLPPLAIWAALDVRIDGFSLVVPPIVLVFSLLYVLGPGQKRSPAYALVAAAVIPLGFGLGLGIAISAGMLVYDAVPPPLDPDLARLGLQPRLRGLELHNLYLIVQCTVLGLMLGYASLEQGRFEWRKGRPAWLPSGAGAALSFLALWVGLVMLSGAATALSSSDYRELPAYTTWRILKLFAGILAMFPGVYFGAIMVARQVRDPEERRRLANPDEGLGAKG
jgi:hypothetical protein